METSASPSCGDSVSFRSTIADASYFALDVMKFARKKICLIRLRLSTDLEAELVHVFHG